VGVVTQPAGDGVRTRADARQRVNARDTDIGDDGDEHFASTEMLGAARRTAPGPLSRR
jgi:hypothetical protein